MRKANRITISLDDQDYAAVDALARRGDVSLSWIIRQAIHRFVREQGAQPDLPLPHPDYVSRRLVGGG